MEEKITVIPIEVDEPEMNADWGNLANPRLGQ
jgi:hypothetical protein